MTAGKTARRMPADGGRTGDRMKGTKGLGTSESSSDGDSATKKSENKEQEKTNLLKRNEMATFKQIYDNIDNTTPKQAWIQRIASATKKKELTVRFWLSGQRIPRELEQEAIARELGVPVEGLFPKSNEKAEERP